jgi:hypothetical protein
MTDPDRPEAVSDAFLDRLADGELSPAELRAAVQVLERVPDGWKRCALAFLEAQAWRESFRPMPVPDAAVVVAMTTSGAAISSRRQASPWRMATAAGLAGIAFLLGWGLHADRSMKPGPAFVPEQVALKLPTEAGSVETKELSGPETVSPVMSPVRSEDAPAPPAPTVPELPERWASARPMPLTEHQQALLEQQGYQVDRRRRLVSARLRDGRRVAVPVDQVQVRYVGLESL